MQILVIGPSWVGDMVMAQSLLIELKTQHPGCRIDVLAPAWTRPVLERMPQVRSAIAMAVGHGEVNLSARRLLAKSLATKSYDQAIVLPNSLKSALVPWLAKIPKRTGWRGEMRYGLLNDLRKLDKDRYPLMIERFLALALSKDAQLPDPLPVPKFAIDPDQRLAVLTKFKLVEQFSESVSGHSDTEQARRILALFPGAEFGESKRWPADYYAQVAAQKIAEGWRVWIMGSPNDAQASQSVLTALPKSAQGYCEVLAGKTSLSESIDLLSCVNFVACNDSGSMHLAAALNIPLVAIFGSTSPQFTPPLGENAVIVKSELSCSPCFERDCPLGHGNCMKELKPELISAAMID